MVCCRDWFRNCGKISVFKKNIHKHMEQSFLFTVSLKIVKVFFILLFSSLLCKLHSVENAPCKLRAGLSSKNVCKGNKNCCSASSRDIPEWFYRLM